MRIERLLPTAQPGRPWTVVLEGGDALRVPEGTVAAFSLYDGLTLEEERLAELEDPEEFIDAFLARKVQDPGDRKQIKKASDALVRRGFSWRQVSEGVARLRWGD